MRGLAGKSVIVTGAASGIGRASAARLLEEGASVMGADLGPAATPPASPGAAAWAFTPVDVTDEESVAALVDEADRALRAGGRPRERRRGGRWRPRPPGRRRRMEPGGGGQPLRHLPHGQARASPRCSSRRRSRASAGAIVTIASIEGIEGTAGGSAYSASKGGVVILTKNMAIDYAGRGIRVNTICPGFIDTPMTQEVIFGLPGMEGPSRHHQRAQARAASASPRRSPRRPPSCCRRTRRSSPATPWSSTAATPRARPRRHRAAGPGRPLVRSLSHDTHPRMPHLIDRWRRRSAPPASDVPAVLALWRDADAEPTHTDDAQSLVQLLEHDPDALVVAELDGDVVGSVIRGLGRLARLGLPPSRAATAHRRQGLARRLVAVAEKRLAEAGAVHVQAIVVESDPRATEYWRATGWEQQVARLRFVKG